MAAAVAEIDAHGGKTLGLVGDVSDPDQVNAHAEAIMQAFGRIDVLVNNAGIIKPEPSRQVSVENLRRVIAINLDGTFFWSRRSPTCR